MSSLYNYTTTDESETTDESPRATGMNVLAPASPKAQQARQASTGMLLLRVKVQCNHAPATMQFSSPRSLLLGSLASSCETDMLAASRPGFRRGLCYLCSKRKRWTAGGETSQAMDSCFADFPIPVRVHIQKACGWLVEA